MTQLKVSHLQAGYRDTRILKDITFSVAQHEMIAVLGRNGCGKTTLLKATGKAGRNLHDVPQEVLENLPALVADPLAVFKSSKNSQNPLGYVAVLNAKNKDGKQIIAVISPKGGK